MRGCAEHVKGGSFAAQHVFAQTERNKAAIGSTFHFLLGPITLRSDSKGDVIRLCMEKRF